MKITAWSWPNSLNLGQRCTRRRQERYKKVKDVKSSVVARTITFDDYTREIYTISETKIALSPYDDKRYIVPASTKTLPWGHWRILLSYFCVYILHILRFMYFTLYTYFLVLHFAFHVFYSLHFMYFTFYTYFYIVHFVFHVFYSLHFMYFTFYTYFYIVHFAFHIDLQILCIFIICVS